MGACVCVAGWLAGNVGRGRAKIALPGLYTKQQDFNSVAEKILREIFCANCEKVIKSTKPKQPSQPIVDKAMLGTVVKQYAKATVNEFKIANFLPETVERLEIMSTICDGREADYDAASAAVAHCDSNVASGILADFMSHGGKALVDELKIHLQVSNKDINCLKLVKSISAFSKDVGMTLIQVYVDKLTRDAKEAFTYGTLLLTNYTTINSQASTEFKATHKDLIAEIQQTCWNGLGMEAARWTIGLLGTLGSFKFEDPREPIHSSPLRPSNTMALPSAPPTQWGTS